MSMKLGIFVLLFPSAWKSLWDSVPYVDGLTSVALWEGEYVGWGVEQNPKPRLVQGPPSEESYFQNSFTSIVCDLK